MGGYVPLICCMKSVATTFFVLFTSVALMAGQPSQLVLDYIDQYKEIAIREMIDYKIPASITLAQGILESGAGQSELARESNNHFGIKCHTDWNGDKVYYDDDEKNECFRKYDHVEDSYRDHSEFLSTKPRYAFLFDLDMDDYKGWAKGLKEAGYATNPKYADILITTIEDYELYKYDKMTLAEAKKADKKEIKKPDTKTTTADKSSTKAKEKEKKEKNKKEDFSWNGYSDEVFYFNRVPAVKVKDGETPEQLAEKHHVKLSLLRDYNDIEDGSGLTPGTNCYLQPKRKKGDTKYHEVKTGETIWSISRDEGVRMSQLYKYNHLEPGQEPAAGEKIYLRSKRKDDIKLRSANAPVTNEKKPPVQNSSTPKQTPVKTEETKPVVPVDQPPVITDKKQDVFIDFDEEEKPTPPPAADTVKIQPSAPAASGPVETAKTPIYHTVAAKETLYGLSKLYQVTIEQLQQWNGLKDNAIGIGQQLIVGYK